MTTYFLSPPMPFCYKILRGITTISEYPNILVSQYLNNFSNQIIKIHLIV
jgi:hypothetical protein